MRKILLAVAVLFLSIASQPVWAENWVKVTEDDWGWGIYTYYIDTESITHAGSVRRYRIYMEGEDIAGYYDEDGYEEADCSNYLISRTSYDYRSDNGPWQRGTEGLNQWHTPEESYDKDIYNYVCYN